MRLIACAFTCFWCTCYGRHERRQEAVHPASELSESDQYFGATTPLDALATLLVQFSNPAACWQAQLVPPLIQHDRRCAVRDFHLARMGSPSMLAKKKGGKGKGGKGKGGKQSMKDMLENLDIHPTDSTALREVAELVVSSYKAKTGKSLHRVFDAGGDMPKALFSAPVAVMVVKAKEGDEADGSGGVVVYANEAACEAHEIPAGKTCYKRLIDLPTELKVSCGDKKFESGYSTKLHFSNISAVGAATDDAAGPADAPKTSITLLDASRWALEKMEVVDGKLVSGSAGVAYAWESWELPDGMWRKPGGVWEEPEEEPPSPEEVQEMLDEVAASIRKLKEVEGKTNQDPEVVEKVAVLKELKALKAELQESGGDESELPPSDGK